MTPYTVDSVPHFILLINVFKSYSYIAERELIRNNSSIVTSFVLESYSLSCVASRAWADTSHCLSPT